MKAENVTVLKQDDGVTIGGKDACWAQDDDEDVKHEPGTEEEDGKGRSGDQTGLATSKAGSTPGAHDCGRDRK